MDGHRSACVTMTQNGAGASSGSGPVASPRTPPRCKLRLTPAWPAARGRRVTPPVSEVCTAEPNGALKSRRGDGSWLHLLRPRSPVAACSVPVPAPGPCARPLGAWENTHFLLFGASPPQHFMRGSANTPERPLLEHGHDQSMHMCEGVCVCVHVRVHAHV